MKSPRNSSSPESSTNSGDRRSKVADIEEDVVTQSCRPIITEETLQSSSKIMENKS